MIPLNPLSPYHASADDDDEEQEVFFRDDFDGELKDGWDWTNNDPTNWSLDARKGYLQITTQRGELWGASWHRPVGNNLKNLLLRNAPKGDFEIITKVDFAPTFFHHQASIVVYQDNDNYIRLSREFSSQRCRFVRETGATKDVFVREVLQPIVDTTSTYLKIKKVGNNYTAYYGCDSTYPGCDSSEGISWTQITGPEAHTSYYMDHFEADLDSDNLKVGLYACSGLYEAGGNHGQKNADFDYFEIRAAEGDEGDDDIDDGEDVDAQVHNITSGDDFSTIQAAVDAASDGDKIQVDAGFYSENVKINTPNLTIESTEGRDNTTVQAGNPGGHVFEITHDGITIKGFTVKDAGIIGTPESPSVTRAGIYLKGARECEILDNTIEDNSVGIWLEDGGREGWLMGSDSNTIKGNIINNNTAGITVFGDFFINERVTCDENVIEDNTITSAGSWGGITLEGAIDNQIKNNLVSDANGGAGLYILYDVEGTIVTGNTFRSNTTGVSILSDTDNKDNEIYHNNFIDNSTQASDSSSNNSWYSDSDPEGGNYWSDWTCPEQQDNDGDGFVDEPEIDGDGFVAKPYDQIAGGTSKDELPFIHENGWITTDGKGVININTKESFDSIQDAIEDDDTINGDTILVYPGNYPENVDVWKSVTIQSMTSCGLSLPVVEGFEVYYTENVTIRGFDIISDSDGHDSGIQLLYSNNALIEHNILSGFYVGIDLFDSDQTEIRDNELTSNEWGIYLYNSGSNSVYQNIVNSGSGSGIWLGDSNNNFIEDNDIHLYHNGIILSGSEENLIQGNTVSDNSNDGIEVEESDNNQLLWNTVTNNNIGIDVYDCDNVTISNSTISSNNRYGIDVMYSSKITIENNSPAQSGSISANAWSGIRLHKSSDCYVKNNTLTDNGGDGIYLDESNFNRITGNASTGHKAADERYPDSGILLADSSNNRVNGNYLKDNDYGIAVDAFDLTSNNNKIVGNTISSNDYGIKLQHAYSGTITQNTISYNTTYGIHSGTSTRNMIIHNNIIGDTGTTLAYDSGTNSWDNEIDQGGNYWSDWTRPDKDQPKGIIDKPRSISGGNNQDTFPLSSENGWKAYAPPKIRIQKCDLDWLNPDYHPGETVKATCQINNSGASDGKTDLKIELIDPNDKVHTFQDWGSHNVLVNSGTTARFNLSLSGTASAGDWKVRATAYDGTTQWHQLYPAANFSVYERMGLKITKVELDQTCLPSSGTVTVTVDFENTSNEPTFYQITAKLFHDDDRSRLDNILLRDQTATVYAEQSTSGDDIMAVGGTYSADLELGLSDSDPTGQYWLAVEAYYDIGGFQIGDSYLIAGPRHKQYVYTTDIERIFTQNEGGGNEIKVHIKLLDSNNNEVKQQKVADKSLTCQTWYATGSSTRNISTNPIIAEEPATYFQVKVEEIDYGQFTKTLWDYGDDFYDVTGYNPSQTTNDKAQIGIDEATGIETCGFPILGGCGGNNQGAWRYGQNLDHTNPYQKYEILFRINVYGEWCQGSLTVLQLGSPADLHLYDSQGRHVGINENGEIDVEIPGVYYNGPESEPEIMKISGDIGKTTVLVDGQEEGIFDLTMTKSTLMGEQKIVYDDVPISLDSQAKIEDNAKKDYTMSIDSDGDGTFEADRAPDAESFDSDIDGVSDDLDFCSGTSIGTKVDNYGCPIDSDGDGVYDGLDVCPWFDDNMDFNGNGIPDGCEIDEEREPLPERDIPADIIDRDREEDDGGGTSLVGFPWIILWIFLGLVAVVVIGRKALHSPKMVSIPHRAPKPQATAPPAPPTEPQTYCSKCGTPNAEGAAFCKKCGAQLRQ